MSLKFFGISGKIGSGKSTTALAIERHMPNKAVLQINFGDSLKSMLASVFRFPVDLCYTQQGKLTNVGLFQNVTISELTKHVQSCTGRICSAGFVKEVFQIENDSNDDNLITVAPCSVGVLLQRFGNAVRNEFGENFWIEQLNTRVDEWWPRLLPVAFPARPSAWAIG